MLPGIRLTPRAARVVAAAWRPRRPQVNGGRIERRRRRARREIGLQRRGAGVTARAGEAGCAQGGNGSGGVRPPRHGLAHGQTRNGERFAEGRPKFCGNHLEAVNDWIR